ncbi:MAG: hypothetical protein RML72_01005 [Bacteroidia bacterium]|nr:hypothetical protein [Bacteroidia bacterium]MDW8157443.1 hypothetical protein [Bacteroidia bacterium]
MEVYSTYYVVTYRGTFGYLKPWSALRDSTTHSQQFLTPSAIQGIQKKLGVEGPIIGHKVRYAAMKETKEITQPKVWPSLPKEIELGQKTRSDLNQCILVRVVLLYPEVHLAFSTYEDASLAASQHICFCRNEDMLFPFLDENGEENSCIRTLSAQEWQELPGFELTNFSTTFQEDCFLVGYNRFDNFSPMYGKLVVTGNPILSIEEV